MVLFTGRTKGLLAPRLPRYFREAVLVTLQKEFHDKDRHWYDLLPESEVKPFSWQELHATCSKITEEKYMATVQDEYHEELYLQRDRVHQTFMRFLEDPTKRGFVLVGGSGVGKSSFL